MEIIKAEYQTFKHRMDQAMTETADHFVQIGYLLKEARDTDVLTGSGYAGMGDFAEAEYGLRPDQTSRFISICDKYGDGGCRLADQYSGMGYAKLSEMLTLPTAITDAMPKDITRQEIRDVKKEVEAEAQISDIEVAIEKSDADASRSQSQSGQQDGNAVSVESTGNTESPQMAAGNSQIAPAQVTSRHIGLVHIITEYFRIHKDDFIKSYEMSHRASGDVLGLSEFMTSLAPHGYAIMTGRIPGRGRMMISVKSDHEPPVFINVREETNEQITWDELLSAVNCVLHNNSDTGIAVSTWETMYPVEAEKEHDDEKKQQTESDVDICDKDGDKDSTGADMDAMSGEQPRNNNACISDDGRGTDNSEITENNNSTVVEGEKHEDDKGDGSTTGTGDVLPGAQPSGESGTDTEECADAGDDDREPEKSAAGITADEKGESGAETQETGAEAVSPVKDAMNPPEPTKEETWHMLQKKALDITDIVTIDADEIENDEIIKLRDNLHEFIKELDEFTETYLGGR